MWKKLPLRDKSKNTNRSSQLQIGAPVLIESSYEQDQLDRARDLSPLTVSPPDRGGVGASVYYNADIRPSRARQGIERDLKLPSLNLSAQQPPPALPTKPGHAFRPSVAASSVYSQADAPAVSPPTSPVREAFPDERCVSPIGDERLQESGSPDPFSPRTRQDAFQSAPDFTADTDMPSGFRTKEWTRNVGKTPMLWDEYSGEPTFDGAGKPSQVKPGEHDLRARLKPVKNKIQTPAGKQDAQKPVGFRERAARLAERVDTRPPWKGSSGRQAILPPPRDTPGQSVPQPQRPKERRVKDTDTAAYSIVPHLDKEAVAHPPETERPTTTASIRPVVRDPGNQSPVIPNPGFPGDDQHPALRNQRADVTTDTGLARHGQNQFDPSSQRQLPAPNEDGQDQGHATSRFSWTTTATTNTYQKSTPPSPPPPVPMMHGLNVRPPTGESGSLDGSHEAATSPSILDRGHPTRRLDSESPTLSPMNGRSFSAGYTARKPVAAPAVQPPGAPDHEPEVIKQQYPLGDWRTGNKQRSVSHQSPSSPTPTMSSSRTMTGAAKLLPKTPQELSSADLVAQLQAQQSDLLVQKRNIERVIRDLEKPSLRNPLHTNFMQIREGEKRLALLRQELAEVIKLDHELGLRLHRAWKRRERDDPNAPGNTFWVRRATAVDND